ncbi:hypothetical protein ACOXXR_07155 [Streptococcus sp. KHUD_013]|uniref:hypothetical protein n=1 Tax=Streptococcus sp. KHUD_013 TaxID=3413147 RepID=UPI00403FDE17
MIDRSYLPYQSARDFQDRGMAKWAGFFLSEHSTALQTNQLSLEELRLLSKQEIRHLLEQAYQQETPLSLSTLQDNRIAVYYGQVYTLSPSEVLIKNSQHYHSLLLSTIFSIEPGDSSYETSPE